MKTQIMVHDGEGLLVCMITQPASSRCPSQPQPACPCQLWYSEEESKQPQQKTNLLADPAQAWLHKSARWTGQWG